MEMKSIKLEKEKVKEKEGILAQEMQSSNVRHLCETKQSTTDSSNCRA